MNKTDLRIQAAREGGAVSRYHAGLALRPYNVAMHSYNAVSLLMLLHPNPSPNLIKAVLWHDVGERWIGDTPRTAMWMDAEFGEMYERLEKRILDKLELFSSLDPYELKWLKAVDTLELWLWTREELALGNQTVQQMEHVCFSLLTRSMSLPFWVQKFMERVACKPYTRLPDDFSKI